jgi:hypothetical protein
MIAKRLEKAQMSNSRLRNFLGNMALVLASVFVCFLALEGYLWADALMNRVPAVTATATPKPVPLPAADGLQIPPEIVARAEARHRVKTMPAEWALRDVSVPGAAKAYYWQGSLHAQDENGFRRTTPFPPKDPNIFRVMVVGDSLTFGLGIPEDSTFVALLNQSMQRDYRIEFLNLGVIRYQSEDVLKTIRTFLPRLQPDLVIYAVCLNDFAPSGSGEYHDEYKYPFPIPGRIKRFLIANTRSGAFLNDKYDAALRAVHLRGDFFDDILDGFVDSEKRFRRDVADMNAAVTEAGLPPVVAMVVHQYPDHTGKSWKMTQIAEDALAKGGLEVIPTEDYMRRYHGQTFDVSAFEGHPNEIANYIWANMISERLVKRTDLQHFHRDGPSAAK